MEERMRRRPACCFLLGLMTLVGACMARGPLVEVVLLSPANQYELGSPMPIKVTIRNLSKYNLWIPRRIDDQQFLQFDVYFIGKQVRYIGPQLEMRLRTRDFVLLHPGTVYESTVDLAFFDDKHRVTRRFECIEPGIYRISASYGAGLNHYKEGGIRISLTDSFFRKTRYWVGVVTASPIEVILVSGNHKTGIKKLQ